MIEQLHEVDLESCVGDGICAEVCPENALELVNGKAHTVRDRADSCISCGQCVAVCPTESLQMPNLKNASFRRLEKRNFDYDEFLGLLMSRRSVSDFRERPVERDVIDMILHAASTAPMGLPPHTTEVVVIDAMVRLRAGAENYGVLKNHILETAKFANELYRRSGVDRYAYHAPVLMMFHANRRGISYEENAHLVCHHAMLAAVSLGLGTTVIGIIPPVVERSKKLRARYGIPKDHHVLTSLG